MICNASHVGTFRVSKGGENLVAVSETGMNSMKTPGLGRTKVSMCEMGWHWYEGD